MVVIGSRLPANLEGRGIGIGIDALGRKELGTMLEGRPGITGEGIFKGSGTGPGRCVLGRGRVGELLSGVLGKSCPGRPATGMGREAGPVCGGILSVGEASSCREPVV